MMGINNIEKICSFYVSNWHLAVMLLPYIKNEVEKGKEITTFLEDGLEENIEILLTKLNFNEETNEKIKDIKWGKKKIIKYSEIENVFSKNGKNKIILVSGAKEYIENVNKSIEKYLNNHTEYNIKIINCYEVDGFNKSLRDVLEYHDKILNTAGEKKIEEVIVSWKKGS